MIEGGEIPQIAGMDMVRPTKVSQRSEPVIALAKIWGLDVAWVAPQLRVSSANSDSRPLRQEFGALHGQSTVLKRNGAAEPWLGCRHAVQGSATGTGAHLRGLSAGGGAQVLEYLGLP